MADSSAWTGTLVRLHTDLLLQRFQQLFTPKAQHSEEKRSRLANEGWMVPNGKQRVLVERRIKRHAITEENAKPALHE